MIKQVFAALALGACAATTGQAASIVSTFDTDAEGWTVDGGSLTHVATGGNPGGYITTADTVTTFMALVAPAAFTGVAWKDGGTLSFDFINSGTGGAAISSFGTVTLAGGGLTAELDITSALPGSVWATAMTTLNAATWGQTQANWSAILGNVTSFRIETESVDGLVETVGIDNISVDLAPIPLPAGLPLAMGGLAALALVRRRTRG